MAISCSESESSSGKTPDTASEKTSASFTLKMNKGTGENPFAQLAYQCDDCSFEQFAAIVPPDGWTKSPTQVVIAPGELRSRPSFDGVPDTVDFVPEIPGNEFQLIAKSLSGTILEMGKNGLMAVVDVQRDTVFRYPAGSRVHELTDPDGNVFVLFAYEVESKDFVSPDFEASDALANHPAPESWTDSTRVLDDELVMDANGLATVLSIRGATSSVWQRR